MAEQWLLVLADIVRAAASDPDAGADELIDQVLLDRQLTPRQLHAMGTCCWDISGTVADDSRAGITLGLVGAELSSRAIPRPTGPRTFGSACDFELAVSEIRYPADPPETGHFRRPTYLAFALEVTNSAADPQALNLLELQLVDGHQRNLNWGMTPRPPHDLPVIPSRVINADGVSAPDADRLESGEVRSGTVYVELDDPAAGVMLVFGPRNDPDTIVAVLDKR